MKITKMLVEYLENPIGLDVCNPRFSWVADGIRYRVKILKNGVAVGESGDIFVAHYTAVNVPFESDTDYTWTLTAWDENGGVIDKIGTFSTGLLSPDNWQARWIAKRLGDVASWGENGEGIAESRELSQKTADVQERSLLLRTEKILHKKPVRAVAYVCGLGFNEFYINGKKIGDKVLTPLITDYKKRALYDTFDVTEQLKIGANAIGIELAGGRFCTQKKYWDWRMMWYGNPRAIVQINLEFEGGERAVIATDETWKITDGAVLSACIYDGVAYSAQEEKIGWKLPDYDDSTWQNAVCAEVPCKELKSGFYTPIKINETITPTTHKSPDGGVLCDFGRNISGWVRFAASGRAGDKIIVRHAEFLGADGNLDTQTNRNALNTDTYILQGGGVEYFEPRFTFHGFQFAEITSPKTTEISGIEGCVIYSAVQKTGEFICDNPFINRLHEVIVNTQTAALIGVPIDCPQRDERLGWLGDAHVTAETCMYNFDMALFYHKWLDDIRLQQHTVSGDIPHVAPRAQGINGAADWSSAYSIIVWESYCHYGDKRVLERHFDGLAHYIEFLKSTAENHICPVGRYGDWMTVVDGWKRGEPQHGNTLYYYYNVINLAKICNVLGKKDELLYYNNMAAEIKQAILETYYNKEEKIFGNGTQFCNAFALFLGLIPEEDTAAVAQNLVHDIEITHSGHLTTGILGTKYLMEALSKYGHSDTAFRVLTKQGYPGWAHLIEGVSTLFERWDRSGSGNHCMFGSVDAWLYKVLGGINYDEQNPAFDKVIISPFFPADLHHVRAAVDTVRGKIVCEWRRRNGVVMVDISVPPGVSYEVQPRDENTKTKVQYGRKNI